MPLHHCAVFEPHQQHLRGGKAEETSEMSAHINTNTGAHALEKWNIRSGKTPWCTVTANPLGLHDIMH